MSKLIIHEKVSCALFYFSKSCKVVLRKNISINIPCLLAYGKDSIYQSVSDVEEEINREVERIEKYFDSHKYVFSGFQPNLLFFVFPIENLIGLRGNGGFYEGLH